MTRKRVVKEENDSVNGSQHPHNRNSANDVGGVAENLSKASAPNNSCKSNRKKMKVIWISESCQIV